MIAPRWIPCRTELDDVRRRIMQHEIEEAALKKEDDALSQ